MRSLIRFLEARIAEDEKIARAAAAGPWDFESAPDGFSPMVHADGMVVAHTFDKPALQDARHVARWSPDRVLAECKAKRAIISHHRPDRMLDWTCPECDKGAPCRTLLDLADVYLDHPDHRPWGEWRP